MIYKYYFRNPIVWDVFIATILAVTTVIAHNINYLIKPTNENILETLSDFSNIGLTSSGFVLTFLTILITFKSSNSVDKNNATENNSVFEIFFASELYFETVKYLKGCIKSLLSVSIAGYIFKLLLSSSQVSYLYYFNVFSIVIIVLTLWRCLLILSKIIELQRSQWE